MPIYTFKCVKCEKEFEDIVKIDSKSSQCPKCKSKANRVGDIEKGGFFMLAPKGNPRGFYKPAFGERDH